MNGGCTSRSLSLASKPSRYYPDYPVHDDPEHLNVAILLLGDGNRKAKQNWERREFICALPQTKEVSHQYRICSVRQIGYCGYLRVCINDCIVRLGR